ncbi:MAG: hypothetical protein C0631_06485 [Sedimenticola sp.]|nr:MAG: hypothetical protein C0631_06485 [Sedimenticola sp.]
MNEFEGVTVVKQANIYFDGAVTSRIVKFANGEVKTLGIMMPGEYTFSTDKREVMEILVGEVKVQLPGEEQWHHYAQGQSFDVAAQASFNILVKSVTDYCCSYLDG